MVYLGCPESAAGRLPVALNAVIIEPVPDALQGHHVAQDDASLDLLLNDKDVIVAGPGLGLDPQSLALMRQLLTTFKTVVLDADGLCVFAEVPNCLPRAGVTVLTPHPGEMARIIDAIGALELHALPRREQAGELALRLKAIIVLKGRGTVIAAPDGAVSVNSSGSPALAAGGSGDVLSGIIGAMLCGADDPVAAVQTAVFVHGLTAEYAPHGMRTLVADDLPELIGTTLQDLTAFA
jgi:NAD(P)H-hydrate epimerase